jgi:parvulin-like peptidyl-prolyl isomerase
MKTLAALIITLLTAYAGISQTSSSDSVTCIPNSQLRAAVKRNEEFKILKEEFNLFKTKYSFLELRLLLKDSTINKMIQLDSNRVETIRSLDRQVENLNQQNQLLTRSVTLYKKEIRRTKWKIWGGAGAVVVAAIVTSILIK